MPYKHDNVFSQKNLDSSPLPTYSFGQNPRKQSFLTPSHTQVLGWSFLADNQKICLIVSVKGLKDGLKALVG